MGRLLGGNYIWYTSENFISTHAGHIHPISLQHMSSDSGRKPKYPEEAPEALGDNANSKHTRTVVPIEPSALEVNVLITKLQSPQVVLHFFFSINTLQDGHTFSFYQFLPKPKYWASIAEQ